MKTLKRQIQPEAKTKFKKPGEYAKVGWSIGDALRAAPRRLRPRTSMIVEVVKNKQELDAVLAKYSLTCDFAGNVTGPTHYGYKTRAGMSDEMTLHLWKK